VGGAGRKHKGRPMVWETRKVRDEASHNWFATPYLPFVLPTNIENALGHAPAHLCTPQIRHITASLGPTQCMRPQANTRLTVGPPA